MTNQQLLNNQTVEGESILLQKFSEVNISDTLPVSIYNGFIRINEYLKFLIHQLYTCRKNFGLCVKMIRVVKKNYIVQAK